MAKLNDYAPVAGTSADFITWYKIHLDLAAGRCEWCHEPFTERGPIADHDHKTGALRALVCHPCNTVEGYGLDRLEKVVAVMRSWK